MSKKVQVAAAHRPAPLCCRLQFVLQSMLLLLCRFFLMPPWNHQAEPWLAAIQQLRNTMLIRHCLGDYNQRLGGGGDKMDTDSRVGGVGRTGKPRSNSPIRNLDTSKIKQFMRKPNYVWCL